jgi:hypothetical protein
MKRTKFISWPQSRSPRAHAPVTGTPFNESEPAGPDTAPPMTLTSSPAGDRSQQPYFSATGEYPSMEFEVGALHLPNYLHEAGSFLQRQ